MELEFIKCQGSGNDFVMIDAVAQRIEGLDLARLAVAVCDRKGPAGADGLLLAVRTGRGFGMRMFNPDGSEAEMCGNGIRCVARLVRHYTGTDRFMLSSGGRNYPVARENEIDRGVPTYGVRIPISTWSPDFGFFTDDRRFVEETIPALDTRLRFTALNLGNPHIVARCERIDLAELQRLGERVTQLHDLFPNGVNVSLYEVRGTNELFTATFERGAGITLSCGTAMTACSTAALLTGVCEAERTVKVRNRGGMVHCICREEPSLATELIGNATFEYAGVIRGTDDGGIEVRTLKSFEAEVETYRRFAERERRD
ncbi:MAG: diaminopimelate epimerase [Alistipes sp.]|nr:diaminopimelate epimerase [Alistipes sp.]